MPRATAPGRLPAVGATLAAAALAAGCGRGAAPPDLAAQLRDGLAAQLGVAVDRVACPAGPGARVCTAEIAGAALPVVVADDGAGGLAWRLDGLVIAAARLEARLASELDDLGIAGRVDCGAPVRRVEVGEQLRCALDVPGGPGAALVTILDDDAAFAFELALDPAAVAARTAEPDEAELDRLLGLFEPGARPDADADDAAAAAADQDEDADPVAAASGAGAAATAAAGGAR